MTEEIKAGQRWIYIDFKDIFIVEVTSEDPIGGKVIKNIKGSCYKINHYDNEWLFDGTELALLKGQDKVND